MVEGIVVIYRKNKTILILRSSERYFLHPKKSILLNFMDALLFWALVYYNDYRQQQRIMSLPGEMYLNCTSAFFHAHSKIFIRT